MIQQLESVFNVPLDSLFLKPEHVSTTLSALLVSIIASEFATTSVLNAILSIPSLVTVLPASVLLTTLLMDSVYLTLLWFLTVLADNISSTTNVLMWALSAKLSTLKPEDVLPALKNTSSSLPALAASPELLTVMLINISRTENVSITLSTAVTSMFPSRDVLPVTLDTILTTEAVRRSSAQLERSHQSMVFSVLMSHQAAIKSVNTILLPEIVWNAKIMATLLETEFVSKTPILFQVALPESLLVSVPAPMLRSTASSITW